MPTDTLTVTQRNITKRTRWRDFARKGVRKQRRRDTPIVSVWTAATTVCSGTSPQWLHLRGNVLMVAPGVQDLVAKTLNLIYWMSFTQLQVWWLCCKWYQTGTRAEGQGASPEFRKVSVNLNHESVFFFLFLSSWWKPLDSDVNSMHPTCAVNGPDDFLL